MLHITGVQKDAIGQEESIELVTQGQLYEKDGISYITYKEFLVTDGTEMDEGSNTMLKLCQEYVSLFRKGSIEQRQEFRLGRLCASSYITPYGSFDMGVFTNALFLLRSECGNISGVNLEYELYLDGHWQSANTLAITIDFLQKTSGVF